MFANFNLRLFTNSSTLQSDYTQTTTSNTPLNRLSRHQDLPNKFRKYNCWLRKRLGFKDFTARSLSFNLQFIGKIEFKVPSARLTTNNISYCSQSVEISVLVEILKCPLINLKLNQSWNLFEWNFRQKKMHLGFSLQYS